MSYGPTNFDNFVNEVFGSQPLDKQANIAAPVAPQPVNPYAPAPSQQQSVPGADYSLEASYNDAVGSLTEQEVRQADALGYLKALNTVKEANYIKSEIGGANPMLTNNDQQAIINQAYADAEAQTQKEANISYGSSGYSGSDVVPKGQIHVRRDPTMAERAAYAAGAAKQKGIAGVSAVDQAAMGLGGRIGMHIPEKARYAAISAAKGVDPVRRAIGYGAPVAAAGLLAAGGMGAHKLMKAHQAASRAQLAQSIGQKVLGHLSRNKLPYALGAGAVGAAGLYHAKSASAEDQQAAGELYQQAYAQAVQEKSASEKVAAIGEAVYQNLINACYEEQLPEEVVLFQQAALQAAGQQ